MEQSAESVDRNPLPESNYDPAEGAIGNWDFNPLYDFGQNFSQDWDFADPQKWMALFQNQAPAQPTWEEMAQWGQQAQQAQQAVATPSPQQALLAKYQHAERNQY